MPRVRLSLIAPLLLLLSLTCALVAPSGAGFAQSESKPKTWPVQTKGQEGLREPQEASTLPARPAVAPRPRAVPALKTRPLLEPRGEGGLERAGRLV